MKTTCIVGLLPKTLRVTIPILIVSIISLFTNPATAEVVTILHMFTNSPDGNQPSGPLLLVSNTLFGTTIYGGTNGEGTVFSVNTDGNNYRDLHSFAGPAFDGQGPGWPFTLVGDRIYGGTGDGHIYILGTDGIWVTNFQSPITQDSVYVAVLNNTIFGAGSYDRNNDSYIFSIGTNGSDPIILTNLLSGSTNGWAPVALCSFGNTLYGIMEDGGASNDGVIFSMNTNGTGYTVIHSCEGSQPDDLIAAGGTLYGVTFAGGAYGDGTLFSVSTNGSSFTNLYSFGDDGIWPSGLVLAGDTLYGTLYYGMAYGNGGVYSIKTNGTCFNPVYSAPGGAEGDNPWCSPAISGDTIYTTTERGSAVSGSVLSLMPNPKLSISLAPTNQVVLSWPAIYQNFQLEITTNLSPPVIWCPDTNEVVVVSNLFEVTNEIYFGTNITYYNWNTNGGGGGMTPPGNTNAYSTNGVFYIPGQAYFQLAQTNSP